jgi:chromosome segregation ATPase
LQAQLPRLQDQIETLTTERDSLKINLGHADKELQSLRIESEKARAQLQLQEQKLREAADRLAAAERERIELRHKLEQPGAAEQVATLRASCTSCRSGSPPYSCSRATSL